MAVGIRQRHRKNCPQRGKCGCTWQAEVFDQADGTKIRNSFPTRAAAKTWRQDAQVALREGRLRAAGGATLDDTASAWLQGAEAEPSVPVEETSTSPPRSGPTNVG